jgi:hypothetical protein
MFRYREKQSEGLTSTVEMKRHSDGAIEISWVRTEMPRIVKSHPDHIVHGKPKQFTREQDQTNHFQHRIILKANGELHVNQNDLEFHMPWERMQALGAPLKLPHMTQRLFVGRSDEIAAEIRAVENIIEGDQKNHPHRTLSAENAKLIRDIIEHAIATLDMQPYENKSRGGVSR